MRFLVPLAACILVSCSEQDHLARKTLIGATVLNVSSAPMEQSILVVAGSRIERIGAQGDVPVPALSEKVQLSGSFLVPVPTPFDRMDGKGVAASILDPLTPQNLAEWKEDGLVFRPNLASVAEGDLPAALEATRTLHQNGIPIAAGGPELSRECALLARAGLSPSDVFAAATVHAARWAGYDDAGVLAAGNRASMWILTANPLTDPSAWGKIDRTLSEGNWTRP